MKLSSNQLCKEKKAEEASDCAHSSDSKTKRIIIIIMSETCLSRQITLFVTHLGQWYDKQADQ